MKNEKLIHDWMVSYLKDRLSRDYNDVKVNLGTESKNEYRGHYPDLILGNHGLVLALMEVETEDGITPEKADEWKSLTGLGAKLVLMVPKASKAKVVDLLWNKGMAGKVSVGSYEISVNMP
ncbi:MAG: hypothetical protein C4560_10745 [Nitrospiraceae bacterium]|nr:MAG: hypothetical protein C4560_10745 [Nitrospiraceae bacterium]